MEKKFDRWYKYVKIYFQMKKQELLYKKFKKRSIQNIKQINKIVADSNTGEVRLFSVMRNESLRLPYFIEYYKKMGVDRFFIIDNNSSDNSVEIALSYSHVHLYTTEETYQNHWFWMEHLLGKFGNGYWCIVVDIDELFTYPHFESLRIHQFCQYLEISGYTALKSILLDMFSDKSVEDTKYTPGQNPLEVVSYFDVSFYEVSFPYFDRSKWKFFSSTHYTGGMRERVFGRSNPITSLTKYSLFKGSNDVYLGQGMHAINGASISNLQGVVFHTKFLSDFIQEALEESVREQHFNKASYYKDFKKEIDKNPELRLSNIDSLQFHNLSQLLELKLLKTTDHFNNYVYKKKRKLFN